MATTLPAGTYFYGLGRRKSATARARLYAGKGKVTINDKPAAEYLSENKTHLAEITDPLALVGKQKDYDITIRVAGGGTAGQVDAIKLAIAKALTTAHSDQESRVPETRLSRERTQEVRSSFCA
jgi:small subunit ribosomal protein S9